VAAITKSSKVLTPPGKNKPVASSPNGSKINNRCERTTTGRRRDTSKKMVRKETTIKLIRSSLSSKQLLFWRLLIKKNRSQVVIAVVVVWLIMLRIIIIGRRWVEILSKRILIVVLKPLKINWPARLQITCSEGDLKLNLSGQEQA